MGSDTAASTNGSGREIDALIGIEVRAHIDPNRFADSVEWCLICYIRLLFGGCCAEREDARGARGSVAEAREGAGVRRWADSDGTHVCDGV
jgi:hypothetical protein